VLFAIKKPGENPEKIEILIDKQGNRVYNGIPYCDSMPFYAILPTVSILTQFVAAVKQKVCKK